jgi:hypothetical protein
MTERKDAGLPGSVTTTRFLVKCVKFTECAYRPKGHVE